MTSIWGKVSSSWSVLAISGAYRCDERFKKIKFSTKDKNCAIVCHTDGHKLAPWTFWDANDIHPIEKGMYQKLNPIPQWFWFEILTSFSDHCVRLLTQTSLIHIHCPVQHTCMQTCVMTLGKMLCAIYNHQSDALFSPPYIRTIQMTFNNTNIASIDHVPFIMQYHRICVHFVFNNDNLVLGNTKTRSVCTFLWNALFCTQINHSKKIVYSVKFPDFLFIQKYFILFV